MNTSDFDIENLKIEPVDMRNHRLKLRRSLLTSPYWNKTKNIHTFLFWKGGEEDMRKRKFTAFSTALGIVAIAIIATVIFVSESAKTAYAEQVAQKSYQAVSTLSPEQLEALKQKVQVNPVDLVQEAKSAKDLKVLTYQEFKTLYPEMNINFTKANGQSFDMEKMEFLRFTDSNGNLSVVGLGKEDNLPIFTFSKSRSVMNTDGLSVLNQESGSISVMGGGFGAAGVSVSGSIMDAGEGMGTISVDGDGPVRAPEAGSFSVGIEGKAELGTFGTSISSGIYVNEKGEKIIELNGKKYKFPEGATVSENEPSTLSVNGDEVYYNGFKLIPAE